MKKVKKNESIQNIMVENPITVNLNQKVSEVAAIFADNDIHHLPVVSGEKLIGIISYSDLLKVSFKDSFKNQDERSVFSILDHTKTIKDLMTVNPSTLNINSTIRDAAEKLSNGSIHSLPIVDDDNVLLGIVTSTDLIRFLSDIY